MGNDLGEGNDGALGVAPTLRPTSSLPPRSEETLLTPNRRALLNAEVDNNGQPVCPVTSWMTATTNVTWRPWWFLTVLNGLSPQPIVSAFAQERKRKTS